MVATSASAWAMRRSPGSNGPAVGAEEVQRPDDLITQPHRQRLHRPEPGLGRGGGKPGPPLVGAARSAAVTGWPVRKQSRHGPWSFWIWNSSSSPAASLEAAATRSSPRGSASTTPAADAASSGTLTFGEHVQEVDDVEVGDHRIGQVDEGVG